MTYSIGEFAGIIGIPTSTLRYYEKEGLLKPDRDKNNLRVFTEAEVGWVRFLLHLKGTGMSMAELKQYTLWRAEGDSTLQHRLDLLKQRQLLLRHEMAELEQNLDIVTRKIGFYDDRLAGETYAFVLYPD